MATLKKRDQKQPSAHSERDSAFERMNQALKAALAMPPKKQKDEPVGRQESKPKRK